MWEPALRPFRVGTSYKFQLQSFGFNVVIPLRSHYDHSKRQLYQLAGVKRVGKEAEVRNPRLQDLMPMLFSYSLHLRLADQTNLNCHSSFNY